MAHAAPTPPGRRRRTIVIGAVIVVVGIVCAVFAVIGLNNPKGADVGQSSSVRTTVTSSSAPSSPPSTPSTAPTSTQPSSTPTTSRPSTPSSTRRTTAPTTSSIPIYVANNTGQDGLAQTAESRFEAKGWKVSGIGNYSNSDIISTCAYWDATVPGAEAAAEQLQRQFPNILRVKQRFDGLPDGPVVVVLNPDYS